MNCMVTAGLVSLTLRNEKLNAVKSVLQALLQVCLYTCGDLIANVPFFEDAEEGFTTSVVTLLRPTVSAVTLCLLPAMPGEGSCPSIHTFVERLSEAYCMLLESSSTLAG